MIALHQNVANCQNTLTVLTLRWRIFPQEWMRAPSPLFTEVRPDSEKSGQES